MYVPEHEKLPVYQQALACRRLLDQVALGVPPTYGDLRNQIQRASISITLNIAEGANEFRKQAKEGFYIIARRSAGECLAAVDIARDVAIVPIPANDARDAILEVMQSLDKLIFALRRRRP